MNYDNATASLFTATARATDAYNAAQDWIANEAPVIEQRLKRTALKAAVTLLPLVLIVIGFVRIQLEQAPVYRIRLRLFVVRRKLQAVRFAASAVVFASATGAKVRALKVPAKAIAIRTMDAVFCLN